MRNYLLVLLIFICHVTLAVKVQKGNAGSWVIQRVIDEKNNSFGADVDDGSYLELLDVQVNIAQQKEYNHTIYKLTNESGVQNYSSVDVSFDPSFQSLTFHHVQILRGNEKINLLKENEFEVIRQETDLSRFIYNGRYTALMILKDVRVGDRIEIDYTLQGFNPVYKGKYYEMFYFQASSPTGSTFFTVSTPPGQDLNYREFSDAPKMALEEKADHSKVYEWKCFSVKAKFSESWQPYYYNDYPRVQVGQMSSWGEVVNWGLSINPDISNPGKELKKKIDEMKAASSDKTEYLRKCVRFVQDDIRYMGIESSINSQRPHEADQTFKQRYGDCKDKSLLLCAMLKANDIEAYPVFINTNKGEYTEDILPSPNAFDHCVVQYKMNWSPGYIDPTISLQRGPINKTYFPNYGKGLVIKQGETDLTRLTSSSAGTTTCKEKFTLRKYDEDGSLLIVSTYDGFQADKLRGQLQEYSRESLQKNYHDFYANIYDSLEVEKPLEILDNELENKITVTEHYLLKHPWLDEKDDKIIYSFSTVAKVLKDILIILPGKERKTPLGLEPLIQNYTIEIETPEEWTITPEETSVQNKFFDFYFSAQQLKKGLVLTYNYSNLVEEVPANDVVFYNKEINKVTDKLYYTITWNKFIADTASAPVKWSFSFILIAIFLLLFMSYAAYKAYRINIKPVRVQLYNDISGWIILPLIGLAITPFRILYYFYETNYFDQGQFEILKANPDYVSSNIELVYLVEIAGNLFTLVMCIFCIICVYKRRDIAPRMMVLFYISNLIILFSDYVISRSAGINVEARKELTQAVLNCIIWIPFFMSSEKVKGTFTIPYDKNLIPPEIENPIINLIEEPV